LKIDETKLKIVSVRAKDRHTRQAEVEDAKWHGINEARKADQVAAAHAADAATAKAKLKVSRDGERAAAEEAARLTEERDAAIAEAEAEKVRAAQADADKCEAIVAAAKSDAVKRAVVATARRMKLEKGSAPPTAAPLALAKPKDDAEPSKREKQIRAIVATALELGFDVLNIPRLGKGQIKKQCLASQPGLFGAGPDPFRDAWQKALNERRVRTLDHNHYTRQK
jgi:hypothetical protein